IIQTAAAQKLTLTVNPPVVNLTGILGTTTVPTNRPANTAISGNLKLTVQNTGNSPLANGQTVQIQVIAHNTGTGDNTAMSRAAAQQGSTLVAVDSMNITVPVRFLSSVPAGNYILEAAILPVPDVTENTADNVLTLNGAGATVPLVNV